MKRLFFLLLLVLNCISVWGQQLAFQKNYYWASGGLEPYFGLNIFQTIKRDYIISGSGSGNFFLIKTNVTGDTIWTKVYSAGFTTGMYSCALTPDSGYIFCGSTDAVNSSSVANAVFAKTDVYGNIQWAKSIGGVAADYARSVKVCSDSGYIAVGTTKSYGAGNQDIYVIRLNQQGAILWTKTFGGTGQDEGNSVVQTSDGGFLIGGFTKSFGVGQEDAILIKIDSVGNLLWDKTYGSISSEILSSLETTNDGNFIMIVGNALVKVNSIGDTLWCKQGFGSRTLNKTKGGRFIMTDGDALTRSLIKIDSLTNVKWSRKFPLYPNIPNMPFVRPSCVIETSDSGYSFIRIADYTQNASIVFVKTDSVGIGGCDNTATIPFQYTLSIAITNPVLAIASGGAINNISVNISGSGIHVGNNCLMTNINAIENEGDYTIYPNPFISSATLISPVQSSQDKTEFVMLEMFGREINRLIIPSSGNLLITRDNVKSGIYFYQIIKEKEIIKTGKIVIQ